MTHRPLQWLVLVVALCCCSRRETVDARAADASIDVTVPGDRPREDRGADRSTDLALTAAPEIGPASGTSYPYGTRITLTAEPQAKIHYTLNGGAPTPASTAYRAPIKLTGQVPVLTVRAIAVAPGKAPSTVSTAVFTLQKGVIVHFRKPAGWTEAYIHYWATVPGGLQTTWPGLPMSPDDGGWYSFSLEGQSAIHLVLNDKGKQQTGDLELAWPEGWYQDGDLWDIDPDRLKRFTFPGGRVKALVLSFDDGNLQDKKLVALFNSHGLRGTFHLNSGLMSLPDKIPAGEVKAVYAGHEVSVHSVSHPHLIEADLALLQHEIVDDKTALEALVGYPLRGLSYPFGDYNQTLLDHLPGWGLIYGRVVPSTGDLRLPSNLLLWRGTCHHSGGADAAKMLLGYSGSEMALLFVWGHSWELDQGTPTSSWSMMEAFCTAVGGKSDVWSAGAAEVAAYLLALRQVELSLTGDSLFNGSSSSVWVRQGGQAVELKPQASLALPAGS